MTPIIARIIRVKCCDKCYYRLHSIHPEVPDSCSLFDLKDIRRNTYRKPGQFPSWCPLDAGNLIQED